jgi:glutamate formiminotransferase/formiminotetrahydrofolate cyclodeaminase
MPASYLDCSLRDFLDQLGSSAPTPGGGAAAALAGALAAELGAMVCGLTIGKPRFAAVEPEVVELRKRLQRAAATLRRLIDEDAAAYGQLHAAFLLPKTDASRAAAVRSTAGTAATVPLETAVLSRHVAADIARLREIGNPNLAADVSAAASLAEAAVAAAVANVRANLPLLDQAARAAMTRELAALEPATE